MREAETKTEGVDATDDPAVINAILEDLAKLDGINYDRRRDAEAKRLGIRVGTLDQEVTKRRPNDEDGNGVVNDLGLFEPEPWTEPVDGAALLDALAAALRRYVVMPDHHADAIALWTVHTHCFDHWRHTPRLACASPGAGCGKSTLLDVLALLVPRALKTESVSTAVLFRVIDEHRPVMLIDEVDSFLRDNEELRGALNAGHAKGGRHLRCVGDDNKVTAFKTFAPVATAGLGRLPGTLADRSIHITLHKRRADEPVEAFNDDARAGHLRDLAGQIARWVIDNDAALRREPELPSGIMNRRADNWKPLISIGVAAGGDWPGRARRVAVQMCSQSGDDEGAVAVMLLADIRDLFDRRGTDRLFSKTICSDLAELEDRPWPEFRRGKPITVRQVASLLAPFGITPGTIRFETSTAKGYSLVQFSDAFRRYVPDPPVSSVTPSQVKLAAGYSDLRSVTRDSDVTDENPLKPRDSAGCDVVTDQKGGTGGKAWKEPL